MSASSLLHWGLIPFNQLSSKAEAYLWADGGWREFGFCYWNYQ